MPARWPVRSLTSSSSGLAARRSLSRPGLSARCLGRSGMKWRLLRVGCDCQDAAEQGGPLQGLLSFRVQGPYRRVVARVERHGFFPQRVLMCQPGRAVPDLNVREARLAQAGAEVCPAYPGTEPLIVAVQRFPAGQRRPAAGLEDPSDLFIGAGGLVGELDGVGSEHRVDAGIGQSRRREPDPSPRLRRR